MRIAIGHSLIKAAVFTLACWATGAEAQTQSLVDVPPAPRGMTNANVPDTNTRPMAVSMYANPYMNPWVNPLLMQGQYSKSDLAWYMFAGQQASMGLGTGRLSGIDRVRGARSAVPARPASSPGSADTPGGNAASYFQRGPSHNKPSPRYFQRAGGRPVPGH